MNLFPFHKRTILPMDVLHFGPCDVNWFGTDPDGKEIMQAFVHRNGWRNIGEPASQELLDRVGQIKDRVDVPGYGPSDYELPFVRTAKAQGRGA
jgi:hypothetical protein